MKNLLGNEPKFGVYMTTRRKVREFWTETKRIVDGEVKQTTCCCKQPGGKAKVCSEASGNKTPCRCDCHRGKTGA